MNNKIQKGLSYFSLFILALGVLPLINLFADEKVEPTKFVIEQNNLEANGFKIANDQVLTSEDVVKLSNVKSVDNLVDVNTLTVSDDQLANVNQVNPDGGLFNLTLTDGQQATITIPVVKEGTLVTTNSKGALIFKNLALSQEANNKEKVLEETGAYSVAFNNGYENKDLTVNVKDNNVKIKDTNLGLSKELVSNGEATSRSGEAKVVTVPHSQADIDAAAISAAGPAQSVAYANENLQTTLGNAEEVQVTNATELQTALQTSDTGKNFKVVLQNNFTLDRQINIRSSNNTFTIIGATEDITLSLGIGGMIITVSGQNNTLNLQNFTVNGQLTGPQDPKKYGASGGVTGTLVRNNSNSSTVNVFNGVTIQNAKRDGWNGVLYYSNTNNHNTILNLYGPTFNNLSGDIGTISYNAGTTINMYDATVLNCYAATEALFGNYLGYNSNQNFYGGNIYNNEFAQGNGYRGINEVASASSGIVPQRATGHLNVYDNYQGRVEQNQFVKSGRGDYNTIWKIDDIIGNAQKNAEAHPIYNPTPDTKLWLSQDYTRNIDDVFTTWVNRYTPKFGGIPLAEIIYTDTNLQAQYQGNGIAEGLYSDWENPSNEFDPSRPGINSITNTGGYKLIEKEVEGKYYAVLVKNYTSVIVEGIDKTNPQDVKKLYQTVIVIPNDGDSFLPVQDVAEYNVTDVATVTEANTGHSGGIQVGTQLTAKQVDGKVVGFAINPMTRADANGNVTVEIQYEPKVKSYTINYDTNGGAPAIDSQLTPVGADVKLSEQQVSKVGYTFAGWQYKGVTYQTGETITGGIPGVQQNETITLTAQWTPITYTVTYLGNGSTGGNVEKQTVTYDGAAVFSDNGFERTGYTFKEWNTAPNGQGTAYTPGTKIPNLKENADENVDLYAIWTANQYQVTFDGNQGSGSTTPENVAQPITKTYGEDSQVIDSPTRIGYNFKGWSTTNNGVVIVQPGQALTQDLTSDTATQTLYAIWEAKTYEVTFDKAANGAEGTMPNQTLTFDQEAKLDLNQFTRPGYKFIGWNTQKQTTKKGVLYTDGQSVVNVSPDATNTTLYAVWEKVTSVTVNGQDGQPSTEDDVEINGPTVNQTPDGVQLPDGGTIKFPNSNKPDQTITLPNNSVVGNDGVVTLPNDNQILPTPDGSITLPGADQDLNGKGDNVVVNNPNGNYEVSEEGNVKLPEGGTVNVGNQGNITVPNNTTVNNDGSITFPDANTNTNKPSVTIKPQTDGTIKLPGKEDKFDVTLTPNGGMTNIQPDSQGNITLPQGGQVVTPNGTIDAPAGSVVWPDGTVVDKDGNVLNPDGSITVPGKDQTTGTNDDVTVKPNDKGEKPSTNDQGNVVVPNGGQVVLPGDKPVTPPNGSVVTPNGEIVTPGGPVINPDGTVTLPGEDGKVPAPDNKDNITIQGTTNIPTVDEQGNVTIPQGGGTITPNDPATGNAGTSTTLPENSVVSPDGIVTMPEANDHVTIKPNPVQVKPESNGNITLPGKDGDINNDQTNVTVQGQGSQLQPNGNVSLPNGGAVTTPEGTITAPNGSTVYPDGTVVDKDGNILNPDGSITVPGKDQTPGTEDDVTITPKPGTNLEPQQDGNIKLPEGGDVTINGNTLPVPPNTQVKPNGDIIAPNGQAELRPNTDGTITLPGEDGSLDQSDKDNVIVDGNNPTIGEDGTITLPEGGDVTVGGKPVTVPNGSQVKPDGTIIFPDHNDNVNQDNIAVKPNVDGTITLPGVDNDINNKGDNPTVTPNNGDWKPDSQGNITLPEGGNVNVNGHDTQAPAGSIVWPDGTIQLPNNGGLIKPDGTLAVPGPDLKPGNEDDVIVKPQPQGSEKPQPDGSIVLPNGGEVVPENGNGKPTTVPNGTIVNPDGTVTVPGPDTVTGENVTVKPNGDGSITVPGADKDPNNGNDNVTVKPNDKGDQPTINPDGTVTVPDGGKVDTPAGEVTPPNGSVVNPDGSITTPNGPIIKPDGNVTTGPDHNTTVPPVDENIPQVDEDGNTHVPNGGTVVTPQGPITVPDGTIVKPDGTIVGPNGEIINPDGSITVPGEDGKPGTDDDVTVKPNDKGEKPSVNQDGNVVVPDNGQVILPGNKPVTPPNGSVVTPEGEIITPGGVIINPDGSVTIPGEDGKLPAPNDKDNITVMPNDGNPQVDENGNVSLPNGGTITPNDPTTGKPGTSTQLPNGSVVAPDGIVTMPEVNDQVTIKPNPVPVKPNADGSITLPGKDGKLPSQDDVTVNGNGAQLQPNGNVTLPNGGTVVTPDGTIDAPNGSTVLPDGTVLDPNGNIINPDGSITVPGVDGNIGTDDDVTVKPNDKGEKPTPNENGNINVPDNGTVVLPGNKPVTPPNVSQVTPQGDIITPNGPIIKPDGNVTTGPDHNTTVPPVDGNIPEVDENGNTHVPNGGTVVTPDGPIKVPDGTIVKPDGTIVGPNGEIINPDGSITVPGADHKPGTDDVTVKPNENGDKPSFNPDGNVTVPDNGQVILPGNKPVTPPNGSVVTPEGQIITPGGVIINPDGSVTIPGEDGKLPAPNDKDNITVMPNDGNPQVDENGNVSLPNGGTITPNDPTTGKPGTSTQLPNGSVVAPDGIVTMPEVNDQVTIKPNPVPVKPNADGSITLPGKDGQLPSQDDVTVNGNGAELQPNGNVTLPNGGTVVTPDGTINAPAGSTVLPDGTVIGPNGEIFTPDGRGWINAQDTTVHSSQAIADITSIDALVPAMNAQAQYDGKAVTPSVSTADFAKIQAGIVGSYPVTFTLTGPQTRALGPNQASVTRIYTIINDEQQLPTPQPQPEVKPTPQAKPQTPTGVKVSLVSALVLAIATLSLVVVKCNRK